MNWVSLLSQFFFASLVTSAAGSVMFLFWFLCSRFLWKLNPKLVYSMLKWVIAMFLLPIAYLGIMESHKTGYVQNMGNMLFIMDFNRKSWRTGASYSRKPSILRVKNRKGLSH